MGALHNASAGYYSNSSGLNGLASGVVAPGSTALGHPGEAWGWAVGAGLRLVNFLLPKDTIEAQANYAKGAMGYVLSSKSSTSYANDFVYGSGNKVGVGYAPDGVFVNGSRVELTEAFGLTAAYQHYWNSQWRTSVIGGYSKVNFDSAAQGFLCSPNGASQVVFGSFGAGSTLNCSPSFGLTSVSTRTAWNPHPMVEIGLDLIWNHVQTAFAGSTVALSAQGAQPAGLYRTANQDNYFMMLRLQKNILP
jgi:hypothetical protein